MHQVLVFQWNLWGWNLDLAKHPQWLALKRSNPHNLVQAGSWWVLTPIHDPGVNVWSSNKMFCWPGVSKFISLILNHHTRITIFNAQDISELTMSSGHPKFGKDSSPPCRECGGVRWFFKDPQAVCSSYWLKVDWLIDGWREAVWDALGTPQLEAWEAGT